MPESVPSALDIAAEQAVTKATTVYRPIRFVLSAALAGAYVGVAVVVLISVTAPFVAAESPAARLVSGAVFGIALALVVFAGSELFTGNVMIMLIGVLQRRATWAQLLVVNAVSLIGNLIGSILFGYLVHAGGTLTRSDPTATFIGGLVDGKNAASGGELFARAILCNMLVCLALWMAMRAVGDGAKLTVLWWPLLAFIVAGFEHCVANMTIFTLGVTTGAAEWGDLARNLAFTVPGNIVGGALIVGGGYWLIGHAPRPAPARNAIAPAQPTPAVQRSMEGNGRVH
jgi:nitrite transporter NirC